MNPLFLGENATSEVNINSDEGDRILFDVSRILNSNVWCTTDVSPKEEVYSAQITYLFKLFDRYKDMKVLKSLTKDEVTDIFLAIVRYGKYFNMSNIEVLQFWSRILSPRWRPALLLVEICLCAPFKCNPGKAFQPNELDKDNIAKQTK